MVSIWYRRMVEVVVDVEGVTMVEVVVVVVVEVVKVEVVVVEMVKVKVEVVVVVVVVVEVVVEVVVVVEVEEEEPAAEMVLAKAGKEKQQDSTHSGRPCCQTSTWSLIRSAAWSRARR